MFRYLKVLPLPQLPRNEVSLIIRDLQEKTDLLQLRRVLVLVGPADLSLILGEHRKTKAGD